MDAQGKPKNRKNQTPKPQDPALRALEEMLIERFGTKVAIKGDPNKGCIRIEEYSQDDLTRIYDLLTSFFLIFSFF